MLFHLEVGQNGFKKPREESSKFAFFNVNCKSIKIKESSKIKRLTELKERTHEYQKVETMAMRAKSLVLVRSLSPGSLAAKAQRFKVKKRFLIELLSDSQTSHEVSGGCD